MYCSGCGIPIQDDLNFCNRCGNKVPKSNEVSVAENLSQAIPYIGGFGLLGFVFALLVMVRRGVDPSALVPISFFYLATLFGICYLIIRHTATLSQKRKVKVPDPSITSQPAFLRPVTTAQLEDPGEVPISVTEHTTKTLDKVLVERK